MKKWFLSFLLFFNYSWAESISLVELSKPEEIAKYQEIIKIIRCPTCQNQNIAESNAPLAKQLRELIISQIKEGKNNSEIENFLIARYGDFISYKPKFNLKNLILWILPLLIFISFFYLVFFKKKNKLELLEEEKIILEEKKEINVLKNTIILFLAALLFFFFFLYFWQKNNKDIFYKFKLEKKLEKEIEEYRIYGKKQLSNPYFLIALREKIINKNIHPQLIFCQLLQDKINNKDIFELKGLADCYANLALFELSEEIFKYILSTNPENDIYFLDWLQNKAFANSEEKFSNEEIWRLEKIIKKDDKNYLARIFLASAYQKNNELEKAKHNFQQLLNELPKNHPLVPAIENALKKL